MSNKFFILILGIFLLTSLIFVLQYHKQAEKSQSSLEKLQNAYKENLISQYLGWQFTQDSLKNILLTNKQKDTINLYSLLQGYKIIFYYTNKMCESCIEKELTNLEKLIIDIGTSSILIVNQSIPSNFYNNDDEWYCNKNILSKNPAPEVPVIFLTYNKNIISTCYTNKMTNHSSQNFYQFIKAFLKTKNFETVKESTLN